MSDSLTPGLINMLAGLVQAERYLEIGVHKGETFFNVDFRLKVAVDPDFRFDIDEHQEEGCFFYPLTSDDFFSVFPDSDVARKFSGANDALPRFDVIFIDGLHNFEQSYRDFQNSLGYCHDKTIWVLDDTVPCDPYSAIPDQQRALEYRRQQLGGQVVAPNFNWDWHGDVFKTLLAIHDHYPDISYCTVMDQGNPKTVLWRAPAPNGRKPALGSITDIAGLTYFDIFEHAGLFVPVSSGQARHLIGLPLNPSDYTTADSWQRLCYKTLHTAKEYCLEEEKLKLAAANAELAAEVEALATFNAALEDEISMMQRDEGLNRDRSGAVDLPVEELHWYEAIQPLIVGRSVVDVDCGAGFGAFMMSGHALKVVGLSRSQEAVDAARQLYGREDNLFYLEGGLSEFSTEEPVDVIVSFGETGRITDDFLDKAQSILTGTGLLIFSLPNHAFLADEPYVDHLAAALKQRFEFVKYFNYETKMVSIISLAGQPGEPNRIRLIGPDRQGSEIEHLILICGNQADADADSAASIRQLGALPPPLSGLYIADQQGLFHEHDKLRRCLKIGEQSRFQVTFNLSGCRNQGLFRFDPAEGCFCVCAIEEIITDGQVGSHSPVNAIEYYGHGFVFLNTDPQFIISGGFTEATYLTIKGFFKLLTFDDISFFVARAHERITDTAFITMDRIFLETDKAALSAAVGALETDKAALSAAVDALETDKAALEVERDDLLSVNGALISTVADREQMINDINSSTSWKVTAPMRAVAGLFRKKKRPA